MRPEAGRTGRNWRGFAVFGAAAVIALAAGWGAGRYWLDDPDRSAVRSPPAIGAPGADPARAEAAPILHRPRPDFELPDLEGRPRRPEEWDGNVLVVNFWATWCAPCREEIPLLVDLARRRPEVAVVGIALDSAGPVRAFAEELDIRYPLLLDDAKGSTMRRYGNRVGALPFTVVAGRDGTVAYVRLGVLQAGELDTVTAALL